MAPFLDHDPQTSPAGPPSVPPVRGPILRPDPDYPDAARPTCGHVFGDELTPDADCLNGCGMTYREWSVGT